MRHESRLAEGTTCPACSKPLATESVQGVLVEACEEHGLWLSHGDLDRIRRKDLFSRQHRRHAALERAKRKGRLEGWLFGWWSPFFW